MTRTRRFMSSSNPAAIATYDFDRDGSIGAADYAAVRGNLGRTLPPLAAPAAAPVAPQGISAVPGRPVRGAAFTRRSAWDALQSGEQPLPQ